MHDLLLSLFRFSSTSFRIAFRGLHICRFLYAYTALTLVGTSHAQSSYLNGVPDYTVFESELIGASQPITDLSTDSFGRLVVASGSKLLTFDGSHWSSYFQSVPEGEEPADLIGFYTGPDDEMYALGAAGIYRVEFQGDQYFALRSIGYDVGDGLDEPIAVIHGAFSQGESIVFFGFNKSVHYNTTTGEFKLDEIDRQSTSNLFPFHEDIIEYGTNEYIYFHKPLGVIESMDTGRSHMASLETRVGVEWKGTIYLGHDTGLSRLINGKIEPWNTEIDLLPTQNISGLLPLSDDEIVVSVKSQGLFVLNSDGQILQSLDRQIDHRMGRAENFLYGRNGVVWANIDQSVLRIDFLSPLTNFSSLLPYATQYPKLLFHEDTLHLVTDGKLLKAQYYEGGGLRGFLDLVPDSAEDLESALSTEEGILYSNYEGVYLLDSQGKSMLISDQREVELLAEIGQDGNLILSAGKNTIELIERRSEGWRPTDEWINSPGRSYFTVHAQDGSLWLEHGGAAVSHVRLVDGRLEIESLGVEEGLSDAWINIWAYRDEVYMAKGTKSDVLVWNESERRLDPVTNGILEYLGSVSELTRPGEDSYGNLWLPTASHMHTILRRSENGEYTMDSKSLLNLRGEEIIQAIPGDEGSMWLVGRDRLFHYEPRLRKEEPELGPTLIYQIECERSHSLLYDSRRDEEVGELRIPYTENSLRLQLTNPNIGGTETVIHQYSLFGANGPWSTLSTSNTLYLSNLSEGAYEVFVRPSFDGVNFGPTSNISFVVLPPFYRHAFAYIAYLVFLVVGIWVLVRFLHYRAAAHNRELQALVQERTKGLDAANQNLTKLYEEVKAADTAKGNFLATVSHEMRTPLNAIIGPSQLLLAEKPNEIQSRFLSMINGAGTHLLGLVDDVLEFTSSGNQHRELDNKRFDLHAAVTQLVGSFQAKAENKELPLLCEISDGMPQFWEGDEKVFTQVLGNLVNNAIKFTETGSVCVKVLELEFENGASSEVHVEVLDTGIGIPKMARKLVFEPFQQVDCSLTRNFDGAGLGLSICRQLVARMKGTIDFESVVGEGTKFWFNVPMRPIREALPPSIKIPIGETDLKSRIVLVVDDNAANRETAGYFLIKMNCRVDYAVNGHEAVSKTMVSKYDLILMDVRMPVMDGIDASMKIRESGNPNNSTPIVVLSAFLSTQLEEEFSESGVDRCLSKPFNLDQLYEAINASIKPR